MARKFDVYFLMAERKSNFAEWNRRDKKMDVLELHNLHSSRTIYVDDKDKKYVSKPWERRKNAEKC
jgi:hypothetical protein